MKSHDDFLLAWSGRVVDLIVLVSSPDIEDRSLQSYCEEEEVVFWVVSIFNLKSIKYIAPIWIFNVIRNYWSWLYQLSVKTLFPLRTNEVDDRPVQGPAPVTDPAGDEELLPADCGYKEMVRDRIVGRQMSPRSIKPIQFLIDS
jgi:hypothetical protein